MSVGPASKDGMPLSVGGAPASSDSPCTCCACTACTNAGTCSGMAYSVTATLSWPTRHDYDLYGKRAGVGGVTYYADTAGSGNGLGLDVDAHASCGAGVGTENISTGPPDLSPFTIAETFTFWWLRHSTCNPLVETEPTVTQSITVTNLGTVDLCVNGCLVLPSESWVTHAIVRAPDGGPNTAFSGGTAVEVQCAA